LSKKEQFIYDRTIREIFQDLPPTFVELLTNKKAKKLLETKYPKVEEKQADLVVLLHDNIIFHLELQLSDDKSMPRRMLYYALLIENKHKKFPKQMVLYLGGKELNTPNNINNENLSYSYDIKYIKELDCNILINSENINDNLLSVLCNVKNINKLLKKLSKRLKNLPDKKREDFIRKLLFLLRLRPKLYDTIQTDIKKEIGMSYVLDKEVDPFYKEGIARGVQEGLERGKLEATLQHALLMIQDYNIDKNEVAQKLNIPIEEIQKHLKK